MRSLRNTVAAGAALATLVAPIAVAHAAPGDKPSTPAEKLLLTDGEFPAGYEIMPFSVAEKLDIVAPLNGFASRVKVSPPECAPKVTPALQERATNLPLVSAFNEKLSTGLTEVLSAEKAAVSKATLQNCSNVTVELAPTAQLPAKAVINVKLSLAQVPGLPAGVTVIATQATGTVTVLGKDGTPGRERKVNVNQFEGVAQVRGYTVVLTASGSQGGRLDRAGFAQALTKAIAKVRDAS